jgi:hypothetical protein
MDELITLNLTLKELQQIDKYVEVNDNTVSVLAKIKDAYPKPKMHLENEGEFSLVSYDGNVYYRLRFPLWVYWYRKTRDDCCGLEYVEDIKTKNELESQWLMNDVKYQNDEEPYCPDDPECCSGIEWDEKDNPKPMNEVMNRLENKYKQAEENAASYITDEVVDRMLKEWEENPPEFLKFEMGKTLEALITRWWCDVFGGINQDWDMETAIDDLIDQIQLWLPKEQDSSGTQSASVIDLVDGYNDALTKIKSKLRNKK